MNSLKILLRLLIFTGLLIFILFSIEARFHFLFPLDLINLKPDYEIHSIDYQLYEFALKNWKQKNYEVTGTWKKRKFIIVNEAGYYKIEDRLNTLLSYIVLSLKEFPTIERETALNFFNSNRNPRILLQENFVSIPVPILPREEIWGLSSPNTSNYNETIKMIASGSFGHLEFSKIGFNRQKTQAIFTLEYSDGPLSGEGSMFIFSLKENGWCLETIVQLWVS